MKDVNLEAFVSHSSAPTRRLLSLLVVALFVLSGCVDFGPVKDYAALSKPVT